MNIRSIYIYKACISLTSAIIITILISFLYSTGREWLLEAISNKSLSFLNDFDLINKIQTKCGFDTIPTVSELNSRFLLFYKIGLFWFTFILLWIFAPWEQWKEQKSYFFPHIKIPTLNIKKNIYSTILLILCIVAIYWLIYYIIYLSWFGGDDYYCGMTQGKSFITKFAWWLWCYVTHVSRIGEIIIYIFPYTLDKSQHLFITPIFICIFPFIVKRVIGNAHFFMNSWKGVIFYISISILSFLGIGTISIITGYAACTNYIYPTIIFLFFLSFYTAYNGIVKSYSSLTYIAFCILSLVSGWATEGLAVTGCLYLFVWLIHWGIKRNQIDKLHYLGIMFFLVGACNVVFSPGPSIRGALTPTLTGGNVPYNLTVLPFHERFFYIPELLQALWPCVHITLYLIGILLISSFLTKMKLGKEFYKNLFLWLALAFISAFVYIVGAIPNSSTFVPASYLAICAFAYLYSKVLNEKIYLAFGLFIGFTIYSTWYMIPRISVAKKLKKYEIIRTNRIKEAILSHEKNIKLPPTLPFTYNPQKNGINVSLLSNDPSKNQMAAKYFHIESICEEKN